MRSCARSRSHLRTSPYRNPAKQRNFQTRLRFPALLRVRGTNNIARMHIPDGFLSPGVWATLDAVSIPAVAWMARRAQRDTEDRRIPLMGVMGAFVFAAQ